MATSEEFETNSYYEKRFFRCGTYSYWAALWFGYLEAKAIIPDQYFPANKWIANHPHSESEPFEQMFQFLVKGNERDVLSAWNDDGGIGAIWNVFQYQTGINPEIVSIGSSAAADVSQYLGFSVFHDLMKTSEEKISEKKTSEEKTFSLVIITGGEGECQYACLYYQYLTKESFVTLSCGDLHVKHTLFQRAAMFCRCFAVSLEELSQYRMKCRCRIPIASEVFQLASTEADRFYTVDFASVMRTIYDGTYEYPERNTKCEECRLRNGKMIQLKCKKRCSICPKCAAIHFFSGAYTWCPVCLNELDQRAINQLEECANSIVQLPFLLKKCYLCYETEDAKLYALHSPPKNDCYLCESCLREEFPARTGLCNLCNCELQFPEQEISMLRESENQKVSKVPLIDDENQVEGETLEEVKRVEGTCQPSPVAEEKQRAQCGICRTPFIDPISHASNCKSHEALCQYCVFYKEKTWHCNRCETKCEFEPPFRVKRSGITLACCKSGNPTNKLTKRPCGHYAHDNASDCVNKYQSECKLCEK